MEGLGLGGSRLQDCFVSIKFVYSVFLFEHGRAKVGVTTSLFDCLVDVVPSQSDNVCYGHPCRFTETIGHCFGFSVIFCHKKGCCLFIIIFIHYLHSF